MTEEIKGIKSKRRTRQCSIFWAYFKASVTVIELKALIDTLYGISDTVG